MAEFGDRLPEWTEDSFPGMLSNVISGRTSNRFDLQGSNFTVDAACASSLAALDVAIAKLRSGAPSIRHRKCQGNRLMQKKERTFWR
jgi:3-oxoacyl-(acyl-carrier-protein) synthase